MMARPFPGAFFLLAALVLVALVASPMAAVLAAMSPHDAIAGFTPSARDALRTSLTASLCATAAATVLGLPAGYFLSRTKMHVRAGLVFLLALPLAFPPVASGLMLIYLFGARTCIFVRERK